MNRQIVPSMFLSVLIVCFFAVILFERDSPKRSRGNDRAAKGKEAGAEYVASDPPDTAATPVTPRPADCKPQPEEQKREPGERKGTAEQAVLPAKQKPAGSSPAQATSRAAAQDKPAQEPQDVTQTPASKTPAPAPSAKESAPRIPAANRSDGPPVGMPPSEPVAEAGPQQSFTTAREGESLRDVAIRVYGSADGLEPLWRANRDALPHKDSPLTAGSVLRTPAQPRGD
jgi:hypothetical protein